MPWLNLKLTTTVSIDESGQLRQINIYAERDPAIQTEPKPTDKSDPPDIATQSPYSENYKSNAMIWSLYHQEAEREDKDLTELLQVGLDQLLIFVSHILLSLLYFVLNHRRPDCLARSLLLSSLKVGRT